MEGVEACSFTRLALNQHAWGDRRDRAGNNRLTGGQFNSRKHRPGTPADEGFASWAGALDTALRDLLDQVTKPAVITPLWRQVPEVVARYASETLGLSRFRLRGLFGTDPLRQTLGSALDWEAVHRHLADGTLDAEVPSMQTRGRLYELLDYEAYNAFDASIYTYNGR